jgi:hypothetical protein
MKEDIKIRLLKTYDEIEMKRMYPWARMNLNRKEPRATSSDDITSCLDKLEQAHDFYSNMSGGTHIVKDLTIKDLILALIIAEQRIEEMDKELSLFIENSGMSLMTRRGSIT